MFPETIIQTCIVHLLCNSLSFASWKDRKPIAQALGSVFDTQNWPEFRTLFADDATLFFPENHDSALTIQDFMEGVDPALAGGVSVHHAVMPENEIVDDYNARGTWEMEGAL